MSSGRYEAQGADWNNEMFPPLRDSARCTGALRCADERS